MGFISVYSKPLSFFTYRCEGSLSRNPKQESIGFVLSISLSRCGASSLRNWLHIVIAWICIAPPLGAQVSIPKLEQVVAAKRDLWGEAAMLQPNGPSYEFFENLLPPPRYVHADFRYYPLVLSAPNAPVKARLVSNGSGINLDGGARSWKKFEAQVTFRVGPDEFRFGDLRDRVSLPELEQGYLPIYRIQYRHPFPVQSEGAVPLLQVPSVRPAEVYQLEAFASTQPELAEYGVVWVRFSLVAGSRGIVSLDVDANSRLKYEKSRLLNESSKVLVVGDSSWKWSRELVATELNSKTAAVIAVASKPLPVDFPLDCSNEIYEQQRHQAIQTWKLILSRSMQVEVPEARVNDAWRNLILQNFSLLNQDRMFYSASNQYESLYEAEGSDAMLAMLVWGYDAEAMKWIVPLLDFTRAGLKSHIAGLKLNDVIRYYWQTRDEAGVKSIRAKWQPEIDFVLGSREPASGLLPKERYCGDISTPVYSLSADAKAWRAIHDMAVVLSEIGDADEAKRCDDAAQQFGNAIQSALSRSIRGETTPPFVPVALLDIEPVHSPITEVRIGSYWNLIMPYVIGSRLFPTESKEENWIPNYIEQHGGLCMGMTRAGGTAHGFWTGMHRVNPLYGTRYVVDALRRDDIDRALTSFYGMLAQGFTRNTFIAGEGSTLAPVDDGGRFFYCPPNSAGNGHFLAMLRNLLVQDWDIDGDGRPETLQLMAATPRRWLEDGKSIIMKDAPTVFGKVSCTLRSEINLGRVIASINLPTRNRPAKIVLRTRVPDGYRVVEAKSAGTPLNIDARGFIDLTNYSGQIRVEVKTAQTTFK